MYLQNKITKILANINKPYIIYYTKGKISSVVIDNGDIKITASNKGYCINIKGAQVILNDLKLIEPLISKLSTNSDIDIKNNNKIADGLVDVFSKNEKTFAVKHYRDKIIAVIIDNPKLSISKISTGYLLRVNSENIAVDNLNAMKKLLAKMSIIKEENKFSIEKSDLGFEQLKLEI
ncbi:MAG: hypothetical protein ACRDD7_15165 [Peptostreptococcaceae bacterium]